MKRSFLIQKGTSILYHLALFSHLHSFTDTITVSERKCIVLGIGKSLGILYSENRTLGIKDYTERVSKHDDAFFNFMFILLIAVSTDWS